MGREPFMMLDAPLCARTMDCIESGFRDRGKLKTFCNRIKLKLPFSAPLVSEKMEMAHDFTQAFLSDFILN